MKRTLQRLASMALVAGMFSSVLLGQIATPPVIDGDGSDAVWATVEAWDLLRPLNHYEGFITGPDDFSASIKTVWDADAIYCLLVMNDDKLDTVSNNSWQRDHYSIYFDMSNIKQDAGLLDDLAEPMDSVQFMLEKIWSVAGGLDLGLAINQKVLERGVDFEEVIDTGTVYTLEVAVPFADIGVTLEAGKIIGFDTKVGDNDTDGQLDGKLALYQTADEGWHNASYIGTAMLEADGSMSRVKVPPVIDGMWDPAWYSAKSYDLTVKNLWNEDFWTDDSDFDGSFSVMHDLDNIYVLLEVKDDILDTVSNNSWERDHYSIYFDISNIKQNAGLLDDLAEPMDSVQFMLEKIWSVAGGLDLGLAINQKVLERGVDFEEVIDTGTNYTLEVAVPFAEIGAVLTEGMVIGYDTKIGDNDGDGQLDHKLSWHQNADESWHNGAYMGNMMLDPVFFDLGSMTDAPVEIAIDGVVDGAWAQANIFQLERELNFVEGFITGDADFSGQIRALWDPDNFYVLLEVNDDVLDTVSNNSWERDHYSVYFDISNIKQDAGLLDDLAEPMDSVQFMLEKIWSVAGGLDLGLAINQKVLERGVEFEEVIDTGSNYVLELVVPFSEIGVTLVAGDSIGWDAKIGDNDTEGQLDGKLAWSQLADEGWHNASYIGTVKLEANGTISGSPVEEPPTTEDVTINVDMNGMIDAGLFVVGTDQLDIAGSFNNWGDPAQYCTDDDADGIYTFVLAEQEIGTVLNFKARMNGDWGQPHDHPDGGPDRTHTVVEAVTGDENVISYVFNDDDYSPWTSVELIEAAKVIVFPNPAASILNIRNAESVSTIELVNVIGQVTLRQINAGSSSLVLSVQDQKPGVYMIRLTDTSNEISYRKLIIE